MKEFTIAFIVLISVLYVAMQHLANWGIRKSVTTGFDPGIVIIGIPYFAFTWIYWYYLIEALNLIL